jgi:hypothetical protein
VSDGRRRLWPWPLGAEKGESDGDGGRGRVGRRGEQAVRVLGGRSACPAAPLWSALSRDRAGRGGRGRGPPGPGPLAAGPRAPGRPLSPPRFPQAAGMAPLLEPLVCARHLSCALPRWGCTERWSVLPRVTLRGRGGRGLRHCPPASRPLLASQPPPLPRVLCLESPGWGGGGWGAAEGVSGSPLKLDAQGLFLWGQFFHAVCSIPARFLYP